ncbi:hypothetical protein [Ruficoccus sp. ZRK36]|uniref:hypothetical protein n=1 Tax=Ruficoccus sp. ZRK36 TaxID=2866311 RepID=UPI001C72F081|nr:hypothetical protein [Ruficoccus sp. ZRK36]QYY35494.1 hypothetical protein K0V07_14495 [Ruficoccus sp. ZRK36]
METKTNSAAPVALPVEILEVFENSSDYLKRRYDSILLSPEELIVFFLSSVASHEVVTSLERQVLILSGKNPPADEDEHLMQTYLDMENEGLA